MAAAEGHSFPLGSYTLKVASYALRISAETASEITVSKSLGDVLDVLETIVLDDGCVCGRCEDGWLTMSAELLEQTQGEENDSTAGEGEPLPHAPGQPEYQDLLAGTPMGEYCVLKTLQIRQGFNWASLKARFGN